MNNTSLFIPQDPFTTNQKSLLDILDRQRLQSEQDLFSRDKLPSFKCLDFSVSTHKNIGSISVIREMGHQEMFENKPNFEESWKNVPSIVGQNGHFNQIESFTKLNDYQTNVPQIFTSNTFLPKDSPTLFGNSNKLRKDDQISKLLSLKVKESKDKYSKNVSPIIPKNISIPTQPNFCGDCKEKDSEVKNHEKKCEWNQNVFDAEKDKIYMVRLKSVDKRPDIFIATCCLNKDFLTKVMCKISKFQHLISNF